MSLFPSRQTTAGERRQATAKTYLFRLSSSDMGGRAETDMRPGRCLVEGEGVRCERKQDGRVGGLSDVVQAKAQIQTPTDPSPCSAPAVSPQASHDATERSRFLRKRARG